MNNNPSTIEPLLVDVETLLTLLSIGKSKFWEMVSTGAFAPEPLKIFGRKKLYLLDDVKLWLSAGTPNTEQFKKLRGAR